MPNLPETLTRRRLPRRTSAPGTRRLERGFFDDHAAFLDTSTTSATLARLNLRHEAIVTENRDVLDGARVLDIASHDGRWSYAALQAGATQVTGIEARPDLVHSAGETLASLGVAADRYRFIAGDVFATLAEQDIGVDAVMCLGFLYHTMRYNELFHLIRRCGPRHLIVDTAVLPVRESMVRVVQESTAKESNAAADALTHGEKALIGRPSVRAIRVMAGAYGFELDRMSDWTGLLEDNPDAEDVRDYRRSERVTLRLRNETDH